MSNVIIGIMGVVLFIGLAIAGASYVGTLVTDGASQKNAAQYVMMDQQVASAVRLYRARTRQYAPLGLGTSASLQSAGYLSVVPVNPLNPGNPPFAVDSSGNATGPQPAWVVVKLGQSAQALSACIEIDVQGGRTDRSDPSVMSQQVANFPGRAAGAQVGCMRDNQGNYVAYATP